jgi:hypothetical protein
VGKSGDRLGKKIEEAKQEVKEEIAQDVDPLRDELDAVKEQNLPDPGTMPPPTGAAPPAPSMSPLTPLDRMKQALEDPRYRCRATQPNCRCSRGLKILRDDAAIVLGMGKSAREIARLKSRWRLPPVYSHLPNIAQTAGIVVTSPTVARVAPTAFRCSALSRSAKSRAMPAPIIARVTMMNASSGRVSWICFTLAKVVVS